MNWTDMMVVHLCEKLGLLYCMSQLGTWVGGWVGGCQNPPPPRGGGHLSVCGYAKILGGWVPELTPPPLGWLSKTLIYAYSTGVYGDVRFPLRRGIKEGCPLSPALFVQVYEAFHQTLTREFPNSTILAYVDDITIISPNQREMQHVLERVTQLSAILGLKMNPSKTQVYRWAPPSRRQGVARRESPTRDAITWGDARLPLQPPIFHYLGHLLAHPTWEQKARDDFVGTAAADLARYQYLPLNAFERVQLLNTVLIPRWTYRTWFLPNDLIKTEYWDRAGGGGNISYDW